MEIGIIGHGVVGKAISHTLSKKFKLVIFDKFEKHDPFADLFHCDFVFIAVPTPFDCKNNEVDVSSIVESLENLENINFSGVAIIKSTVTPSTCEALSKNVSFDIVFNPEFLRESTTPNEDFRDQEIVVIGTSSVNIFNKIKKMFELVLLPEAQYFHTSTNEAEMIKLAQNTMLASRVAIANMLYDACLEKSIDYNLIRNIAFDKFEILGPYMSLVPGPDGNRGFGGKCLPKDIRAFNSIHNSKLLKEIIHYNDFLRDDLHNFLDNYSKN
ncbi:MAG: hypothetical protein CL678_14815 [Bdellovibrionaceae bacterium]|nr:hypothetical protein [Pseudobdellovibrionaceae bacterium]|tara:strand:+ start:3110 stop:3919 length:810 start_codon:yes stop_codon:yes gene_type:complete